jgi:PTH2 family peptidyl-tRNA hydrolase
MEAQQAPSNSPQAQWLQHWWNHGCAKITLQVSSLDELKTLAAQAKQKGLIACTIADAGRTEVASGTITVLGIGPGPNSLINQITGKLQLLQ